MRLMETQFNLWESEKGLVLLSKKWRRRRRQWQRQKENDLNYLNFCEN